MPTVPDADRYTVTATTIPNCYRLVIRHGYTDEVITEDLAGLVADQIRAFVARGRGGRSRTAPNVRIVAQVADAPTQQPTQQPAPPASSDASSTQAPADSNTANAAPAVAERKAEHADDGVAARLRFLDAAVARQTVYIVGKEQMRVRGSASVGRRCALQAFLWLRENSRSRIAAMRIPTDKLVEVGFVKEV